MVKILQKISFTFFCVLIFSTAFGQVPTITFGNVDPGPYAQNSSIAVPITVNDPSGTIDPQSNKFQLYLLDAATGSFANGGKPIGEYIGHYTTFINGILPGSVTAVKQYKFMVRVTLFNTGNAADPTTKDYTPATPTIIEVKSGPANSPLAAVLPDISSPVEQTLNSQYKTKTFGYCTGIDKINFTFTNSSTTQIGNSPLITIPDASVTTSIINGFDATNAVNPLPLNTPFAADLTHYTIFVKAKSTDGLLGTKAYFLVNNQVKVNLTTSTTPVLCLPFTLDFGIDLNAITKNFPGNVYRVDWGEGGPTSRNFYSINKLKTITGVVNHTYTVSSCGRAGSGANQRPNSFTVDLLLSNAWCQKLGNGLSAYATVLRKPENDFTGPSKGCVNVPVKFTNISIADIPNSGVSRCDNLSQYNWYVDGVLKLSSVAFSLSPSFTFSTTGWHEIELELASNITCEKPSNKKTKIYIQAPPKADFDLVNNKSRFCLNEAEIVKVKDKSTFDTSADAANTYDYSWTIDGPGSVDFVNATSATSKEPQFKFTAAGKYKIALTIQSGCLPEKKEIEVVVNDMPAISETWQTAFCGKDISIDFNTLSGNAKTAFSETFDEAPIYKWEVSGGSFSFKTGSDASKEPTILFKEFKEYKVKITYTNSCGTKSIEKKITFYDSPKLNAGTDQIACSNTPISLIGTISGTYTSLLWKGGAGSFSNSTSLITTYTPAANELGTKVTLTLSVNTASPAPCNIVEDQIDLTISNSIARFTSTASGKSCAPFSLQSADIIADVASDNDTYTWFANGVNIGAGKTFPGFNISTPGSQVEIALEVSSKISQCGVLKFSKTFETLSNPTVKFIYQTEACTSGPVKVTFTNTTESASSYSFKWNFGKDLTSEKQNPAAVYFERSKTGNDTTYNISLEITSGTCGANAPTLIPITVIGKALDVKFDADTSEGCNSLTVNFKNLTKGAVRYLWFFGDGDSCICAGANVNHTYKAREKPYSVKLIAFTTSGCSDIYEIRDFIKVSLPPAPKFTAEPIKSSSYKYVFEDATEGDVKAWQWDFGDGSAPVNSRNPLHSYLTAGDYNVTLTVTSYSGCTETATNPLNVIIDAKKGSLFVPNAFMPNSEVEELRTFAAKGFGLSEWRMRIFNKWGETIWETAELNPDGSPAAGWNGKLKGLDVPQGVYFWEIKAKYKNGTVWPGTSYNNSAPKHVGTINLIR